MLQNIVEDINNRTGLLSGKYYAIGNQLGVDLQGANSRVYVGTYYDITNWGTECVFKLLGPLDVPDGETITDDPDLDGFKEEEAILKRLKSNRNSSPYGIYVTNLIDSMLWTYKNDPLDIARQVYVFTFEKADCNLTTYLKDVYDENKHPNKDKIKKEITVQLLKGIAYCHSVGIIHMDLKPDNVLVLLRSNTIQLTDFGNSVIMKRAREYNTYEEVIKNRHHDQFTTLYWRAPEMLYKQKEFTRSVDVWAIGCMFITLLAETPVCYFRASTPNLMKIEISKLIGSPSNESWPNASPTVKDEFNNLIVKKYSRIQYLAKGTLSSECISFIKTLLSYDHITRITAENALNHPFISSSKFK